MSADHPLGDATMWPIRCRRLRLEFAKVGSEVAAGFTGVHGALGFEAAPIAAALLNAPLLTALTMLFGS